MKKTLHWAPRVLGILFALFISIFAPDVFGEGYSFWESIVAFLIHLVPTYLAVAALLVACKWEVPGGLIYISLAVWYLIMARGQHWTAHLFISGPLLLTGALFLIDYFASKPEKSAPI